MSADDEFTTGDTDAAAGQERDRGGRDPGERREGEAEPAPPTGGDGGGIRGNGDDRDRDLRPALRKAAGWAAVLVAGLLLLYLAAALVLRATVPPDRLARWAEPRAEAALNRGVEIGGASIDIFPRLGVSLQEVSVGNLADFEGPPLAEAREVGLRVSILPLFTGRVVVGSAAAEGLTLRLQVDASGRSNFGDFLPAEEAREEGAPAAGLPVTVDVRRLAVEDGSVEYRDRRNGRWIRADAVEGSLSLHGGGDGEWRLEAEGATPALSFHLPERGLGPVEGVPAEARLSLRTGADFGWVAVDEGSVRVAGVPLHVAGRVDSVRSPVRRLDLALRADSVPLAPAASAVLGARAADGGEGEWSGEMDLRASVRGKAGDGRAPEVDGELALRSAGYRTAGGRPVADGISARATFTAEVASLERLQGTFLGGPLTLRGRLALDSVRGFTGRVEARPDLRPLLGIAGPPGTEGSGTLELSADLAGSLASPATTRADGTLLLRDMRVISDSLPVPLSVSRARVELRGREFRWTDLPLQVGSDALTLTGSAENLLAALDGEEAPTPRVSTTLEGPRLDLSRLFPPEPADSVSYGRLFFARLGEREVGGGTVEQLAREKGLRRPASLPVAGRLRVRLDTLLYEPYRLHDLSAELEFGPEAVRLREARFGAYGGRVRQSFTLGLGPGAAAPFEYSLTVGDVAAVDFLAVTSPLGRLVSGTLDLRVEAAGSLDTLLLPLADSVGGRGSLTLREGGVAENPLTAAVAEMFRYAPFRRLAVDRWELPFRVVGNELRVDSSRVASPAAAFLVGGSVGLDGGLDLGARMTVPAERVSSLSLEAAGLARSAVERLAQQGEPLTLGLRVEGSLAAPRLGLQSDALRESAARAMRGAVRGEVDRRLERGRDAVREAVERQDTALQRQDTALARRAKRILNRFLPGRGDTAEAAPDTAGAEPDTAGRRDSAAARRDTAAARDTAGRRARDSKPPEP